MIEFSSSITFWIACSGDGAAEPPGVTVVSSPSITMITSVGLSGSAVIIDVTESTVMVLPSVSATSVLVPSSGKYYKTLSTNTKRRDAL